jgi:hypothetical protein
VRPGGEERIHMARAVEVMDTTLRDGEQMRDACWRRSG